MNCTGQISFVNPGRGSCSCIRWRQVPSSVKLKVHIISGILAEGSVEIGSKNINSFWRVPCTQQYYCQQQEHPQQHFFQRQRHKLNFQSQKQAKAVTGLVCAVCVAASRPDRTQHTWQMDTTPEWYPFITGTIFPVGVSQTYCFWLWCFLFLIYFLFTGKASSLLGDSFLLQKQFIFSDMQKIWKQWTHLLAEEEIWCFSFQYEDEKQFFNTLSS